MQSKDSLDQEIMLSRAALPVHPRLLEELQAEHAWLKQRVRSNLTEPFLRIFERKMSVIPGISCLCFAHRECKY